MPFQAGQAWRHGDVLVATKNTELPPICIKTGVPTNLYRIQKLSWHTPWAYLGLLGGLLPFVLAALITTKRGQLRVALSPETIAKRRNWIIAGWLGCLGIAVAIPVGANTLSSDSAGVFVVCGIILFLIWVVVASRKCRLLSPVRINETHVFVKGIHPNILQRFPVWESHNLPTGW
jgi:hypothetical protein